MQPIRTGGDQRHRDTGRDGRAARRPVSVAREAEVLAAFACGLTNKQTVRCLSSAPITVGHRTEAMYRKAGVGTWVRVTLFAMEQGHVEPAAGVR